jgi:guanylate kinase
VIKLQKDNFVYYFRTQEHYQMACEKESFINFMQFADAVINTKDDTVVKVRFSLEDVFDTWAEAQSDE